MPQSICVRPQSTPERDDCKKTRGDSECWCTHRKPSSAVSRGQYASHNAGVARGVGEKYGNEIFLYCKLMSLNIYCDCKTAYKANRFKNTLMLKDQML